MAPTQSGTFRRVSVALAGWLLLAGSVSAYVVVSASAHQPFHVGLRDLRFFDLRVYRGAADRVLDNRGLYRGHIVRHLGFTYPPAAALLLSPLALFSLRVDEWIVSALNVLALVWMLQSTLRMAGRGAGGLARLSLAAGIAAAALWAEPVSVTLGYGQIDLLIAALVIFDLSRPPGARGRGIAIGIAAGLKLTPLMFIVYLACVGQRRCAATAAGAFVMTIVISFITAGRSATHYWGGLVFDSARVGGAADVANQSLRGALARLLSTPHPGAGVELMVILVAVIGLALAIRAARRGQAALGFGLCAVTTLLASPVSWTHHWALAVPALVLLVEGAYRRRSAGLGAVAIIACATFFAYLPERFTGRRHYTVYGLHSILADPYVIAGLLALMLAAALQHRRRDRRIGWADGPDRTQPTVGPTFCSGAPGSSVTAGAGSS